MSGINRNRYIALMSAITLRENPGETIVTDSCTSNGVATFIQQLGGKHYRWGQLRGRCWVGEEGDNGMPASGEAVFASWHRPILLFRTPLPGTMPIFLLFRCLAHPKPKPKYLFWRRYKKGYKNIINKGIELNEAGVPCPLMMETSGHGAMRVRRCCHRPEQHFRGLTLRLSRPGLASCPAADN